MKISLWIVVLAAVATVGDARAAAITATGSSVDGRSATATFEQIGNNLVVTITNTSTRDAMSRSDLLTGIRFTTADRQRVGFAGGLLTNGSQVLFGNQPVDGVLNNAWALRQGRRGARRGSQSFSLNAANQRFGRRVGSVFSLVSGSDDSGTGDGSVTGASALISNQISIVLTGLPAGFDPMTQLTGVVFQFGARRDPRLIGTLAAAVESVADEVNRILPPEGSEEPGVRPPVSNPAPPALLGGLALLGMLANRRRGIRT